MTTTKCIDTCNNGRFNNVLRKTWDVTRLLSLIQLTVEVRDKEQAAEADESHGDGGAVPARRFFYRVGYDCDRYRAGDDAECEVQGYDQAGEPQDRLPAGGH